jgi:uncharacterized protein YjdB
MYTRALGIRTTSARLLAACLVLAASACKKDESKPDVALQRIDVAPPSGLVAVGLTTAFTATGVYSDGSTQDLTARVLWSVEDGVAFFPSASPPGTALGMKAGGPSLVHAVLAGSGVVGQGALTVTDAVPVSIDVTPAAVTLAAGLTRPLVATAVLSDGSHLDVSGQVTWSSSAATVASVSGGTVSAHQVGGPVLITAALASPAVSGTASVTVSAAAVASIDVTPATGSVAAGRTLAFTADAVLTDGTRVAATEDATWSSADPGIASVSNTAGGRGVVTAVRAGGPVTLTVRLPGVAAAGAAAVTVTPAELVSLSVSPSDAWLAKGTGAVLRAAGVFSDGTRADLTGSVTWTSSDPSVVSVGNGAGGAGVITALAVGGPVTLTAALPSGGPSATANVTVTPAALVSLEVAPATASVALGRAQRFTATGVFSDGSRQDLTTQVSWLSSDADVASVSNAPGAQGLAQSRAEGAADVVAWYPGSSTTAAARFTVTPPEVVSLAIAPAAATIPAGRAQRFAALGTFTDAVVRDVSVLAAWSTDLPAVAVATATVGEYRGGAVGGPATITATVSGIPATAQLTVGPPVLESIALTPASVLLRWGEATTMTALGTWSDGSQADVTGTAAWSASPVGVVRLEPVAGAVRVTGRGIGATVVTVEQAGIQATADARVDPLLPDRIDVVPGVGLVQAGATMRFRALATFPGGAVVDVSGDATWLSGDGSIALPGLPAGTFEALTAGTTSVTATLGVSGTASIQVTDEPPVRVLAALRIDGNEPPLGVGGVAQLRAVGTWSDGVEENLSSAVTWSSSDEAVVTVAPGGLVEALAVGSATVTALHDPSMLAAQAGVAVLPERAVEGLVVRLAPRIVAGQFVPVAAVGLLAGGGEVDLTDAVQWVAVSGGTSVSGGYVRGTPPRAEVAALFEGLVAVGGAEVVPLEAASRLEIVPGDATVAPVPLVDLTGGGLVPFVSVLTFDDALPREVIAGDCTDETDALMDCAITGGWFDGFFGEVPVGCEALCMASVGSTVCLPLAPTTRTVECRVGARTATATLTVSEDPPGPGVAGLFIRPSGWQPQVILPGDPLAWEFSFDFRAPPPPRLHPGEQAGLEALAVYSDASIATVPAAWSSTAPPIASVDVNGLVTARAPGPVAIQAVAAGRSAILDLDVLPAPRSAGISLAGPVRLEVGATGAFQAWRYAGVLGEGSAEVTASVTWSSSDPAIAAFDPEVQGLLVAQAAGDVVVTARSRDGFTAQQAVQVVGVDAFFLIPSHATVAIDAPAWFQAWVRLTDGSVEWVGEAATWSLDDPGLAWSENDPPSGAWWTMAFGSTTVRAQYGALQATATLDVLPDPGLPAVAELLVGAYPTVAVGQTVVPQVSCVQTDTMPCAVDASFGWETGDPAIAVPVLGDPTVLSGVAAGATTFTVTDPTATVSATAPVHVYALSSIEVSPMVATVGVGELVEFLAVGVDTLGARHPLGATTWSSSDPTVAANPDPGTNLFNALSEGSVTITVSANGLSGTAALSVGPARVTSFQVTPASAPVELGTSVALRAMAWYGDGTSADVTAATTWRSLDETVLAPAAGGPAGTFDGVAPGATAVVATWTGGGATQTAVAALRVKLPIEQLGVFIGMEWVAVGDLFEAQAGALFGDGTMEEVTQVVTWTAEPPGIVEPLPEQPGLFRALAAGSVDVVATSASGATGFATLMVMPPYPVAIEISPMEADGVGGQPTAFTATAVLSDGSRRDVTEEAFWDANGMGEFVAPGLVVPTQSGDLLITARIASEFGEASGDAWLHVPPFLVEVQVSPQGMGGYYGQPMQFTASARYDTWEWIDVTTTATWSADRAEAITTGTPGEFRFEGHGDFNVTATLDGGLSGSANVWIDPAPVALTLVPDAAVVDQGSTRTFQAWAEMSDGLFLDVTWDAYWTTTDGLVGSFGWPPGEFYSAYPGTAEAVASWSYGSATFEARAPVTVVPVPVELTVTAPSDPLLHHGTYQLRADLRWSDGSFTDETSAVVWTPGDPSIVPDGPAGSYRFDAVGVVTVWAETVDGRVSAGRSMTVVPVPVSLSVAPGSQTVDISVIASYAATVTMSDGSNVDATWGASWWLEGAAIANYLGGGQFFTTGFGAADVVVSYGDWGVMFEGRASLTVAPTVWYHTIEPSTQVIRFDQPAVLTVWEHWTDGSVVDVTGDYAWEAGSPTVLTLDAPGRFVAAGPGTSMVYAMGPGGDLWADVQVLPFADLVLAPLGATRPAGGTVVSYTVTADASTAPWDATPYVAWESSDPGVADFIGPNPNDAVTGLAGTTTITGWLPGGVPVSTSLTVE